MPCHIILIKGKNKGKKCSSVHRICHNHVHLLERRQNNVRSCFIIMKFENIINRLKYKAIIR